MPNGTNITRLYCFIALLLYCFIVTTRWPNNRIRRVDGKMLLDLIEYVKHFRALYPHI